MANVKDIGLSNGLDLRIENGDFFIEESDQNHILLILKSYLGAFKEFPLVGLGIDYYLASSGNKEVIRRNMTVQLNADGYKVNEITIRPNNEYFIDAIRVL